jgi:hypothetical protein
MDCAFIPPALPQLFNKDLILSHAIRRSDRTNQRSDPSVEKKYVHPHPQKGEIFHKMELSDRRDTSGGTETSTGNIQPASKVDP